MRRLRVDASIGQGLGAACPAQWAGRLSPLQHAGTMTLSPSAFSSTRKTPSPAPVSTAGWCRLPRWRFICALAWPYGFSVFCGCRCRVRWASSGLFPAALRSVFGSSCSPQAVIGRIRTLGWMYTLFVLLGSSAALWGGWLERAGPRKAGVVSALCWSGGMLVSALGVHLHQFWLMVLGSGVIGGIGLGLGYISPVSTLIKWFPDRRGMATGMAIMGFGGGAMIGSPLARGPDGLFFVADRCRRSPDLCGDGADLLYVFMLAGAFGYRVPETGWQPPGWTPPVAQAQKDMITQRHVHVSRVWGIPPVLAAVAGAVHERQRRHWGDRHGLTHAAGGVWRRPDWACRAGLASWTRPSWLRLPRSRRGLRRCSRCSTLPGVSSGPACRTAWGGDVTYVGVFSCWGAPFT